MSAPAPVVPVDGWLRPGVLGLSRHGYLAALALEAADARPTATSARYKALTAVISRLTPGWTLHFEASCEPRRLSRPRGPGREVGPVARALSESRWDALVELDWYRTSTVLWMSWVPTSTSGYFGGRQIEVFESTVDRAAAVLGQAKFRVERLVGRSLGSRYFALARLRPDTPEVAGVERVAHLREFLSAGQVERTEESIRIDGPEARFWEIDEFPRRMSVGVLERLLRANVRSRWISRIAIVEQQDVDGQADAMLVRHKLAHLDLLRVVRLGFESAKDAAERRRGKSKADTVEVRERDAEQSAEQVKKRARTERFCNVSQFLVTWGDATGLTTSLDEVGVIAHIDRFHQVAAYRLSLPGSAAVDWTQRMVPVSFAVGAIPTLTTPEGSRACEHKDFPHLGAVHVWRSPAREVFGFSPWQGDVGHQIVLGETGTGKSVLMAHQVLGFVANQGGRVFGLDKGGSLASLAFALGGRFIDLNSQVSFAPMADAGNRRIEGSLVSLALEMVRQQGGQPDVEMRAAVTAAVRDLGESPREERRLSRLVLKIQNQQLRRYFDPYIGDGPFAGLMDGAPEKAQRFTSERITVVEISSLLEMDPEVCAPVVQYLAGLMKQSLGGGLPTLLVFEEAARTLGNSLWAKTAREYFDEVRKDHGACAFLFQRPGQMSECGFAAALRTSPTRIYCPLRTPERDPEVLAHYDQLDLSRAEIEGLEGAEEKRQYYVDVAGTRSWVELVLTDVELAILARAGKEVVAEVAGLREEDREEWLRDLLEGVGVREREWFLSRVAERGHRSNHRSKRRVA